MRFINTSLVLLLGLALIGCAARAGAEAADVAVKGTVAASSQAPNASCEQKPARKRKPIINDTSKPSPQSNEVYVYCGDASAAQHSTPSPGNGKGLLPGPDDSTAKTSNTGKQDSITNIVRLGAGKEGVFGEIRSQDPYIFVPAMIFIVIICGALIRFSWGKLDIAKKAAGKVADEVKKALAAFARIGLLVGIVGLAGIFFLAFVYVTQPSLEEYRAAIVKAISEARLEGKVTPAVDTQLELQQCMVALQQEEDRIRRLEATTESWPFSRGIPYLLFGAAVGLIVGMLICIPLDVLLSVRRRRYSSDSARDDLLDELQKELVSKETETMREILRRLRDKPKSDKAVKQPTSKPDESTDKPGESTPNKPD